MNQSFPKMIGVRQIFPKPSPIDIPTTIRSELRKISSLVRPDSRIAVGVGSRGIANLSRIVGETLSNLKELGARPFIIPAMGSHGGATPEGQLEVLASYGISEATMQVPIKASLEVRQIGATPDG